MLSSKQCHQLQHRPHKCSYVLLETVMVLIYRSGFLSSQKYYVFVKFFINIFNQQTAYRAAISWSK